MTRTHTLVFPPGVEPQVALAAMQEVLGEATRGESGHFVKVFEKSPGPSIVVHRWVHDGDGAVVDLTIDATIPAIFLSVMSPDGRDVQARAAQLNELLDLPSPADYVQHAAETMDETVMVLAALANQSEYDPALADVVTRAFGQENPGIISAGIHAAALLEWPKLLPALRRLHERETDPELLRLLDVAISKCGG